MSPYDYIAEHQEEFLARLIEFARIPSVSTDPAYKNGILQAADWVKAQLEDAGIASRIIQTQRHPVVYGEWLFAPDAPTILVYGHYDVQPPDPLDKWVSKPFEPTIRNDRLYARGVSDDKGSMLLPILVAKAYIETQGKLPINVRFLFEGEEEIGSVSLKPLLQQHPDWFQADFVLSADGAMWRIDEPSITVASRGMMALEIHATGASKDLHSGRYGGAIANPLHAMANLLASLHDASGRVAVSGFYDHVIELSKDERDSIRIVSFDVEDYLSGIGVDAGFGEAGYSTLERLWSRPTLEVNGMWGGYQGPGSKSVIPNEAFAKITARLVANQDPDDICQKVIQHIKTQSLPGITLDIKTGKDGAAPYHIPSDHIGLQIAKQTLYEIYRQEPIIVRMGGTLPIAPTFKELFGMDMVFFSFSTADEDFHASNEFFRIQRFYDGLMAWTLYWEKLAQHS